MKISIITPTFNSEKSISENVKSVLSQSYKEYEHIIIDNCSEDSTLEIISELYKKNNSIDKLIIISEKDEGISDAFNKGIKKASGDIITILNSDDKYFYNDVFADVVKFLKDEILFIHGDILFLDERFGSNLRRPLLYDVRVGMPFNHPTMFLRKEIFTEVGYFDKSYRFAMDFEFICRMSKIFELPSISFYLNSKPMVVMNAGGVSWKYEIDTINETKRALKSHHLWNAKSLFHYSLRIMRAYLKIILNKIELNSLVKIWRNKKWSN